MATGKSYCNVSNDFFIDQPIRWPVTFQVLRELQIVEHVTFLFNHWSKVSFVRKNKNYPTFYLIPDTGLKNIWFYFGIYIDLKDHYLRHFCTIKSPFPPILKLSPNFTVPYTKSTRLIYAGIHTGMNLSSMTFVYLYIILVTAVGSCGLLTIPMTRSILSRMTPAHQQGKQGVHTSNTKP